MLSLETNWFHQSGYDRWWIIFPGRFHRINISLFIGEVIGKVRNWFHGIALIKMLPSSLAYSDTRGYLTANPEACLIISLGI
jgi:hypothetical protein